MKILSNPEKLHKLADKGAKIRKRVVRTALGTVAAVSVAVSGLFGAPEELVDVTPPPAIVMVQPEAEESAETLQEDKQRVKRGGRLRAWVQGLPAAVRYAVLLPLWCIGRVLTLLISALWTALSPLGSVLLGFLLNLLLALGVAILAFKLLFPELSLHKLFTRRNIIAMLACALLLTAADHVLPLFWEKYAAYSALVKTLVTLLIPIGLFFVLRGRRAKRAAD